MTTRFGVFAYEDVEPIDIGATYGVLSMARRVEPSIEIATLSPSGGEVRLTNGLSINVDYSVNDAPDFDVLMVLGGSGWSRAAQSDDVRKLLHRQAKHALLVSVCTGALILAEAGLLNGHAATTRRRDLPGKTTPLETLGNDYHTISPTEATYVDTGRIITGGGVTLAIDTTLYVIERLFGKETASLVADITDYSIAREANRRALFAVTE